MDRGAIWECRFARAWAASGRGGDDGGSFEALGTAEGDGEGVGHVGGGWQLCERKVLLNHALHLVFPGVSKAGERLLHFVGLDLDEREPCLLRGEEKHASSVAHDDRGGGVFVVGEEAFDGERVRGRPFEQGTKIAVKFNESCGDRAGGWDGVGSCGFGFREECESDDAGLDDRGRGAAL